MKSLDLQEISQFDLGFLSHLSPFQSYESVKSWSDQNFLDWWYSIKNALIYLVCFLLKRYETSSENCLIFTSERSALLPAFSPRVGSRQSFKQAKTWSNKLSLDWLSNWVIHTSLDIDTLAVNVVKQLTSRRKQRQASRKKRTVKVTNTWDTDNRALFLYRPRLYLLK